MQSGVGYYLSAALVHISGGHLFLLLILVVIASLILGMGMVTVGAYIIVSILVSPAMIKMGIPPIAAHFFPFYFAIISAITPPVAVASYAGAGIAGANPWKTGMKGIRLAIPALAIPFIFVTQPSLLFLGTPLEIVTTIVASVVAVVCLAGATVGYFLGRLNVYVRIALAVVAFMLLVPATTSIFLVPGMAINLVGVGLLVVIVLLQKGVQWRRAGGR